jgi:hypothetical protein
MTRIRLSQEVRHFLEANANKRSRFKKVYSYYHEDTAQFFQKIIQPDSRILMIGWDNDYLASRLKAAKIDLLDLNEEHDLSRTLASGSYDYILLPFTLQLIENIQEFLQALRAGVPEQTRVVALQYNFFWVPLYKCLERLGLKAPTPDLNWLSDHDVQNFFHLARYQVISTGYRCLVPFRLLGLSRLFDRSLASFPFIEWLCHKSYAVTRPWQLGAKPAAEDTVSVIVPARNEAGNIGSLLDRLPKMGSATEVVFVEGHSQDETWAEIQKQAQTHPRRGEFTLSAFQQSGIGKADAVRLGFSKAQNDILMILDADLSVPPEELPLFYSAIASGVANFANGSRLVYHMESQAMQLLNLFFNKLFGIWLSWMIQQPVKDTLCGTKALLRKDYARMKAAFLDWEGRDPFGDFELLLGAAKLNLKICDVPIAYKQRTYGSTNIRRFTHGWQLFKMCLVFWAEFKR